MSKIQRFIETVNQSLNDARIVVWSPTSRSLLYVPDVSDAKDSRGRGKGKKATVVQTRLVRLCRLHFCSRDFQIARLKGGEKQFPNPPSTRIKLPNLDRIQSRSGTPSQYSWHIL